MNNIGEIRGTTGEVKIVFAIPTDDREKWGMRNGRLTFSNGAVASLDVEGGYIPYHKGNLGLTMSCCFFKNPRQEGSRLSGDITMMTCVNGRVMDSNDIAFGVELIPLPELANCLAGKSETP